MMRKTALTLIGLFAVTTTALTAFTAYQAHLVARSGQIFMALYLAEKAKQAE